MAGTLRDLRGRMWIIDCVRVKAHEDHAPVSVTRGQFRVQGVHVHVCVWSTTPDPYARVLPILLWSRIWRASALLRLIDAHRLIVQQQCHTGLHAAD